MASRKARGAAAEPAPPPAPEPTPEPEPPKTEKTEEASPLTTEEVQLAAKTSIKDGNVTEKIIERIIICPGMQPQYPGMMGPPMGFNQMYQGGPNMGGVPPPSPCSCPEAQCCKKKNKKRRKKKGAADEEPCRHPFCIVQRAKLKPQGLPWASGMYPGPPSGPGGFPGQQSQGQGQPSMVVFQRPVLCCCPKCKPPEDTDSEDDDEEDPQQADTETFMTFMNLVFAAANVINERPEIL